MTEASALIGFPVTSYGPVHGLLGCDATFWWFTCFA